MDSSLSLKTASISMLDDLSDAHLRVFTNNFMALMGRKFLIDYYRFALESEYSEVFYIRNNEMFSWAVVYFDADAFLKEYRKLRWAMILNVITSILKSPNIITKLTQAIKKTLGGDKAAALPKSHYFEVAIVGSRVQGRGNTKLLMQAIIKQRWRARCDGYRLEVDELNYSAIGLYESLGFDIVGTLKRGERLMYIMELDIGKNILPSFS
ncbi:GNAT family N-acetyltransferase [Dasania marina]|uniref:GNAT family N-acetyltransferase n=1 Tax=Dasania marina TaxID=471499 RepID=UPI000379049B|nr:GNAT family N-acetyltransferase [Dasania marina]